VIFIDTLLPLPESVIVPAPRIAKTVFPIEVQRVLAGNFA
jgi:hypothetical protein